MTPLTAIAWLAEAAAAGQIHTVRASWSDRLGAWRGKRLPVDGFLESPSRRISFCDGMIVVDVSCDIFQTTPFSNFETGYPDMYLRPDLQTLRQVGWAEGEAFVLGTLEGHDGVPLAVAPRNVLGAVLTRLAQRGIEVRAQLTLGGRLMHDRERAVVLPAAGGEEGPDVLRLAAEGLVKSGVGVRALALRGDGGFELTLADCPATEAGDGAVLAKAALKEVALRQGQSAVFMTRLPGSPASSELRVDLRLEGAAAPDPQRLRAGLRIVRGLLQPSVNAFKAPPPEPAAIAADDGGVTIRGLRASSEADPITALAALAAASAAAPEGAAGAGAPRDLTEAADLLGATGWAGEWLGPEFVANAAPLLRQEAELFAAAVTDWELDRYWTQG